MTSALQLDQNNPAQASAESTDYRVLARRWRPRDFSAMAGQEPVVEALVNGLDSGRVHHAFLFTGTRGVGKTTLARILAKCLNCEQGVSASPCGECSSCLSIDEGRFVDLIEVDAASRTKVDDTRELLDNVQYAPTRGRYKVYLIDEVHMLSLSSFNALLKTLEEPPPHVKFILATTDPQKIPVTILSRCLRFNLRRLPATEIDAYLQGKLNQESVAFEAEALLAIARAADGSMRDALSLLDQALAHGQGKLQVKPVQIMLGMVEDQFIEQLLHGLQLGDAEALLDTVREIYAQGQSADRSLQQLAEALHRIAIIQQYPDYANSEEQSLEALQALAEHLTAEDVQLYFQIAVTGRQELKLAPDPRIGLEMTLLRMLAFRPADGAQAVVERSAKPAPASKSAGKPVKSEPPAVADAGSAAGASSTRKPDQQRQDNTSPAVTEQHSRQSAVSDDKQPQSEHRVAEQVSSSRDNHKPLNQLQPERWSDWIQTLSFKGAVRMLAQHLLLDNVSATQNLLEFKMEERDAHMHTQSLEQSFCAHLHDYFKCALNVKIRYTSKELSTVARTLAADRDAAHDKARSSIENDPVVNSMLDTFNAQVVPGSIKPASQ